MLFGFAGAKKTSTIPYSYMEVLDFKTERAREQGG